MLRIDSHQHFWDRSRSEFDYQWLDQPSHQPIGSSFLPQDLLPLLQSQQIDASILVQTQHRLAENDWALGLAAQWPWIAGVVGWVDLQADDCQRQVEQYCQHAKFVGVRHVIQDEPDPDFLIRDSVLAGLHVLQRYQLPFDLLLYPQHLHHVPQVAAEVPDLPLVLNHLGKPAIRRHEYSQWLPQLQAIAACPNVYCKLSGLVTEANWNDWSSEDLQRYLWTAIECFGPQRCLFGSDWPVCLLAATYDKVLALARSVIGQLSDAEQRQIMGENACVFYRL